MDLKNNIFEGLNDTSMLGRMDSEKQLIKFKPIPHTLENAVTAKLCGATGEKSIFVIAPNSLI